jgi:signal transduction histidine kinase
MLTRHPLLSRQLRKSFGVEAEPPAELESMLSLINSAYVAHEEDRRLLEHSLEVVSEELSHRNRELVQQLRAREQMEVELHQALKLEAVGQLAAGIAHEINTPIQYIGDSVEYVHEAFADVRALLDWNRVALSGMIAGTQHATESDVLAAESRADIAYALEQIPLALERTLDGVSRVATLVRAMKDFAHPDSNDKVMSDVNAALRSTTLVASNEIRRVAELVLELSPLPPVPCHLGEISQVFLNLLVNAAHAIGDAGRERGTITVQSSVVDGSAEIRISDTGHGIPPAIRDRVFEPFFTTKDVGRGSGQGLAIARSIVHDKHAGSISFESIEGEGTTFVVRLPLGA